MGGNLVVIGSTNVDLTMRLDHLPRKGETVGNGDFYQAFGGKGAIQAIAAARCGGKVKFISCVGDDDFGRLAIESLKINGVNVDNVFTENGLNTGTALIFTDVQGNNCVGVSSGANESLLPEKIASAGSAFENVEMVLLQCEMPYESIKYVIDASTKYNKKLILNLAPARNIDVSYLSKAHVLVVNEPEAEFLSGFKVNKDSDIEHVAELLLAKGPEHIIITLGARGAYYATSGQNFFVESFSVEAKDSTGAGDIFCGALAVALTEKKSFKEALTFASAAAAISVTRLGAFPSAPRRAEIEELAAKR